MFEIELPKPPSVNTLYATVNGRRVLSKVGRQYKQGVADMVKISPYRFNLPVRGYLCLSIIFIQVDKIARDIDNLIKILQDSLQYAGVFADDKMIDRILIVRRREYKNGQNRVYVTVESIGNS